MSAEPHSCNLRDAAHWLKLGQCGCGLFRSVQSVLPRPKFASSPKSHLRFEMLVPDMFPIGLKGHSLMRSFDLWVALTKWVRSLTWSDLQTENRATGQNSIHEIASTLWFIEIASTHFVVYVLNWSLGRFFKALVWLLTVWFWSYIGVRAFLRMNLFQRRFPRESIQSVHAVWCFSANLTRPHSQVW